jgi:hypothetical protein
MSAASPAPAQDAWLIVPSPQQEPLDAAFLPPSYDAFSFQQGLPTTQGSPDPAISQTPLPVGSVDSGIGGEMEDSRASRTRSSSEEKESLTPAQSRRKAQNRAAYVVFLQSHASRVMTNRGAANEPSANARSDTSKTSRPSCQPSSPARIRCSRTTSV